LGDGRIGLNVDPGSLNGEVVVRVAPYDATGLRADSWRWQPGSTPVFPPEGTYYDIRQYGALPGLAGKAATTAAFNAIFAAINWGYFPSVTGKGFAYIYVPSVETGDAWYIGDVDPYVGSQGSAIFMVGDGPSGYGGFQGSTIVYDGTPGGTMFEFIAISLSNIQNITFNLGGKAKYGVNPHQYWNPAEAAQVPSNWLYFVNCVFANPIGDYDSALVLAGQNSDPPSTLQSADYRFSRCLFSGHATVQGYGFANFVGGNTKQWAFYDCTFQYVYQGIHTQSGFLVVQAIEGANIGYNRDSDACLVYAGGTTNVVSGFGFENGSTGYQARAIIVPQGCPANITGGYFSGTCPPDDVAVSCGGPTTIDACSFQNGRILAASIPWATLTPVLVGQVRTHDSGKWYTCVQAGTTGASGPTGTGSGIPDGSAKWDYSTTGGAHIAKFRFNALTSGGTAPIQVSNCSIPFMDGVQTTYVPLYDGSNNLITGSLTAYGTDLARYSSNRARAFGNVTYDFLVGAAPNITLDDFSAYTPILVHEQLLTDLAHNSNPGQTVIRNDNEVFAATVPAAVIAACIGTDNQVILCQIPDGRILLDAVMHVTTGLSGSGVTGIKLGLGTTPVGPGTIDILTATAADVSDTYIGKDVSQRAARWEGDRCVFTPLNGGGFTNLLLMPTITGGAISDIDTGSVTVYVTTKRWGTL
jgi:hypothetical protein